MPSDPKNLSLVNGEKYFVMYVEHVIGEKKHECEMLNVFVKELRRFCGKMCCDGFRGYLFGVLELYL